MDINWNSHNDIEKTINRLERAVIKDYIADKKHLTQENRTYINSVQNYMNKLKREYAARK